MSDYVNGKNEILYIWNDNDEYEPIVCLTSNGLSETVESIEGRSKCDTNGAVQKEAGSYSYEIPFEGLLIDDSDGGEVSWSGLRNKLRSLGTFTWKIATTYGYDSTEEEYGTAFFSSLEKTGAIDEFMTFSGNLTGSGNITSIDPNAGS